MAKTCTLCTLCTLSHPQWQPALKTAAGHGCNDHTTSRVHPKVHPKVPDLHGRGRAAGQLRRLRRKRRKRRRCVGDASEMRRKGRKRRKRRTSTPSWPGGRSTPCARRVGSICRPTPSVARRATKKENGPEGCMQGCEEGATR